jgi:hypothetical protein
VDEDFLAQYQMNYGFSDTSTATSTDKITCTADTKENTGEQLTVKRKAGPQAPSECAFCNSVFFHWEWQNSLYLVSCLRLKA